MLQRLRALWCERHGHRYHEVGRIYSGPEGRAREVVLEACRVCGAQRDRPSSGEAASEPAPLDEQARLDFLARARRRALRRATRRRG
jgi:hypothetical protein